MVYSVAAHLDKVAVRVHLEDNIMATVLPPPTQGFNPLGFLVPALQGLLQGQEKVKFAEDLQNLTNPDFTPQSQQGQQLLGQNMFQNLGLQNQPITPAQREAFAVQREGIGQRRDAASVQSPTQQIANMKLQSLRNIEAEEAKGNNATDLISKHKQLFGGQSISVKTGNPRLNAEQSESELNEFQKRADDWNWDNLASNDRRSVQTTTNGRDVVQNRKSEGEIATTNGLREIQDLALRAKELYDPDFVGMVVGSDRIVRLKKATGTMSAQEAKFRQNQDSLIKKMYTEAGKQLSDREIAIHMRRFPEANTAPHVYEAQSDEFIMGLGKAILRSQGFTGQFADQQGLPDTPARVPQQQGTITTPGTPQQPANPQALTGGPVTQPEISNAITRARKELPSTATDDQVLDKAEQIIRDVRAKKNKLFSPEATARRRGGR